MMVKPELVKKIRNYFSLNIYETKVWLALVSKGIASAGEIAEMSGVPRSRTYDVLESLEKQGFAIAKIGKPTKYIAVKPTLVLEKLKKQEMQKASEKIKVLDNLKETPEYEELQELHDSSVELIKKEELSGSIKGKSNILSHIKEASENAEKEIILCMPASEIADKGRLLKSLFEKKDKSKDINLKLVLNGTEQELKTIGEKYGVKPVKTDLKLKFLIVDRKQVLFSLTDSNEQDDELAVWLNSEFLSSALAKMFETTLRK